MSKLTAFITGAGSGIGLATAERLAKGGYNIIMAARRMENIIKISAAIGKKYGVKVWPLEFDVRDRAAVDEAILSLPASWKNIDVLVNSAGVGIGREPIQNGLPEDWDVTIDTNIKGLLYVTRALLPKMIKRKTGHIVNIASISGLQAYPNGNVYSATKYAVRSLSDNMRIDLLPNNIKVTTINPGRVKTGFMKTQFKGDRAKIALFSHGLKPLSSADVAETIFFVVTRPPNVVIAELTIVPRAQADANNIFRKI